MALARGMFNNYNEGEEMKSSKTRLLAVLMVVAMLASIVLVPSVAAAETDTTGEKPGQTSDAEASSQYTAYLNSIADKSNAKDKIVINAIDYKEAKGVTYGTDGLKSVLSKKLYNVLVNPITGERVPTDCLVWSDNDKFQQQGSVVYEITVPADGVYNMSFTYLPLKKTGGNEDKSDDKTSTTALEIAVFIDGQTLYAGLDGLKLPRKFINSGATVDNVMGGIRVDTVGNQLTPDQVQYEEFVTGFAVDPIGVIAEPYAIFLSKGTHTIELESVYEPFALANITLEVPETTPSYEEYIAKNNAAGAANYTGAAIQLEGENAWLKSTNSLVSKADNGSCHVTPSSHVKTLLNYIGSTNWQAPGESIVWVVDVKESGYYKFGVNYKQSAIIDGMTYLPFLED